MIIGKFLFEYLGHCPITLLEIVVVVIIIIIIIIMIVIIIIIIIIIIINNTCNSNLRPVWNKALVW